MIEWKEQKFNELNNKELYEIFKLRCEVFVVEQEILYNDFDDKDYKACLLYTSPSPRDRSLARMPSSA